MPDPSGQVFKHVEIPELPALLFKATALINFVPTERLTLDRLTIMLKTIPDGFLSSLELDLLVSVIRTREAAIAFTDTEQEHTPWVQAPIWIPKAIEETVWKMLIEQRDAGKYEYSTASYRSRIFTVAKKSGLCMVHDIQELNKVTIRDSALPP
jgi:hypothetical protein